MADPVGQLVPLVMIPRYTTYTGAGTFETAPLDVSEYDTAILTFWRGPLIDTNAPPGGSGATFAAIFEESHDALTWTSIGSSISTYNTSSKVSLTMSKRWFRLKITLTGRSDTHMAAITCWAVGSLEKRIP